MASPPDSPTSVDYEILSLGGTTTAFDTIPDKEAPVSMQARVVELSREVGRLRQEIKYYRTLVNEVLHPVLVIIDFHTNGLDSALEEFNAKVERARLRWQADRAT
jgi:hypothetical protein